VRDRAARIRRVIDNCLQRRAAGQDAPDEQIIGTYPELMPELGEELHALGLIENARQKAAALRTDPSRVPTEWDIGDVIRGVYEVVALLGEGGMGTVYRVHHRQWNTDLAVKRPRAALLAEPAASEDFLRECETWIHLGPHPHAVSGYYVRTLDGVPHIFAEYVEDGSLQTWIRERRLTDLLDILDVAIQTAWGLQHAHDHGLIHHDVKPANVLMTPSGTAKVTDFGLAKAQARSDGTAVGDEGQSILVTCGGMTPAYCSPEQAERAGVSRRTDVWSWAVTVLEMFAGAVTWSAGPQAPEALTELTEEGAEDSSLPLIPEGLAGLLRRCLTEDPVSRPNDMKEIAGELEAIYATCAGHAYPRPAPSPVSVSANRLNNRALSLLDLGKPTEAHHLLARAIHAEPHHPEATYNRALLRWRAADIDDETLLKELREVCRSHPRLWTSHYAFGLAQLERANVDAAEAALAEAQHCAPAETRTSRALEVARSSPDRHGRCLATLRGHTNAVLALAGTADAQYILSGSVDGTLRLWGPDTSAGRVCLRTFREHDQQVNAVCMAEEARQVVSGSTDGTLKLWDVATARCLETVDSGGAAVLSLCLDRDGQFAVSGGADGALRLWNLPSGLCLGVLEGHTGSVLSVAPSPDARVVVSASADHTLRVWDVDGHRCLGVLEGHTDRVRSVCLAREGGLLLSGSDDHTLKLWDLQDPAADCLRTFRGHTSPIRSVCVTPDGRVATSGSADRTIKLWDVSTGRCLRTLRGHDSAVAAVALSHDARLAVSGGDDGTLRLWRAGPLFSAPFLLCRNVESEVLQTGERTYRQGLKQARVSFALGDAVGAVRALRAARAQPGCSRRAEAMDAWCGLYLRLARKGFRGGWADRVITGHAGTVLAVHVSRDGRTAVSGGEDRSVRVWDVRSGRSLHTLEGHGGRVTSVRLTGDGREVLSASEDGTVTRWSADREECGQTFTGHTGAVRSAEMSRDARIVLSGGDDGTLRIWDASTGACLRTIAAHKAGVACVGLSADGRFAFSGSRDRTLRLWNVATGQQVTLLTGHTSGVTTARLSENARVVLSGSNDRTLRLWEVATGRCIRTLTGHAEYVQSVWLCNDGRFALSGGGDATLKLWDMVEGCCVRTLEGHTATVHAVCASPDGRIALTAGEDGTLRQWVLDWELEDNAPADWDEAARPYLDTFLTMHTPYAAPLPEDAEPSNEAVARTLTRRGAPNWTEEDFKDLLHTIGCAGGGWIRAEGVRRELGRMAQNRPSHRH